MSASDGVWPRLDRLPTDAIREQIGPLTAYERELRVLRHELLAAQELLLLAEELLPEGETRHRIERWLHR